MERALKSHILRDLPSKIVLLTGPRQCGKTTLSKQLYTEFDYFNYDSSEDRIALAQKSWDRHKQLLIFDELHKMKGWKRWLKGIFDTEGIPPEILVTGSARLDIHRRAGDSLAGRYFQYRLHPFDLKEAIHYSNQSVETAFEQLWTCSGFPEPFLRGNETFYKRWRRTHIDMILRQDLVDLSSVRDITSIETLVMLLRGRVGSSVSYANLARDLDRDANTVKRWISLLENLYIIYRVVPYHKNIARSLLKEPKFYFYDHSLIEDKGARLENLVSNALKKELHFLEDTQGLVASLHYMRTKEGKEIDFLVNIDGKPRVIIEVKTTDGDPTAAFEYFRQFLPKVKQLQLVKNLTREKTYPDGVEVRSLINWLAHFKLID